MHESEVKVWEGLTKALEEKIAVLEVEVREQRTDLDGMRVALAGNTADLIETLQRLNRLMAKEV